MTLRRLTSLESGKLEAEARALAARIAELQVRAPTQGDMLLGAGVMTSGNLGWRPSA